MASVRFHSVVLSRLVGLLVIVFVPCAVALQAQGPGGATDPPVFPITMSGTEFSGAGVDWIVDAADASQFVMFGEQHGVAAIPRFVSTIYRRLHPSGFDHLVLEMGPWIATQLSTRTVEETIRLYPYAIAFDFNAELDLLRTAKRLAAPRTGQRIWGIDQMFTAIHPFERLSTIAPTSGSRRLARGLQLKATVKAGNYLRQGHYRDIEQLRQTLAPAPGSEQALIIDAADRSMGIYTRYRQGQIDESVRLREAYMTELLTEQYNAAVSPEVPLPRAVFKLGGAHVMEGIGPNGIPTLGDFAQRLAASHGSDALNIGIRVYREDGFGLPTAWMAGQDAILVDYRTLRTQLNEYPNLPDERRADIEAYDAAVYLNAPAEASKSTILDAETDWQRRTLVSLLPLLVSLTLLLTSLAWPLASVVRVMRRTPRPANALPVAARTVATLYAVLAVAVIAWQVRTLLANPLASPLGLQPASLDPWLTGFLVAATGTLFWCARSIWRDHPDSTASGRWHYGLLCVAAVGFIASCWMWHLPGIAG